MNIVRKVFQNYDRFYPEKNCFFDIEFFWKYQVLKVFIENPSYTKLGSFAVKSISELPKFETKIVTQNHFGSSKSYPVYRDYSGELTVEIYMSLGDTSAYNTLMEYTGFTEEGQNHNYLAPTTAPYSLSSIVINKYSNAQKDMKVGAYVLKNPIITNLQHSTGLSADGEEAMIFSLTIHYDGWTYNSYWEEWEE